MSTGISWPALNQIVCALRFFYGVTLGEAVIPERILYAREPRKLPVILSPDEVVQFLEAVSSLKCRAALRPKLIFWRAVDLLMLKRIEIPTSFRLTELVLCALQQRKQVLTELVIRAMTDDTLALLDGMFLRDDSAASQSPHRLTLLKRLSQSTRPVKIRERLVELAILQELYSKVEPVLSVLNFSSEAVRYFASSVTRMRTTDLRRRAIDDIHVHLITFIAHQFYRLQDNLVDVLLALVKTFENTALREHRDWCFDQRKHPALVIGHVRPVHRAQRHARRGNQGLRQPALAQQHHLDALTLLGGVFAIAALFSTPGPGLWCI